MTWKLQIPLLLFIFLAENGASQLYLQLETRGSLKTQRLEVGDEMGYTLKSNPREWYYGVIEKLYVDGQVIQFEHDVISLTNIAHVRLKRKSNFLTRSLPIFLISSGASFAFFGTIAAIAEEEQSVVPAVMGAAAVVTGLLLRRWTNRVYRLGKKRRLRIVDLNFYEVPEIEKT